MDTTGPFTLLISFEHLMLLVMALFMFVGAMRGVQREVISTLGLVALLALLIEPRLVEPIVEYLSRLLRLGIAFLEGRGTVDPGQLIAKYQSIEVPFDGENPYPFFIVALLAFVLLSYSSRGMVKDATALGRMLGGLLGLCNGFLATTLVREYLMKYLQRRSPGVLAAAAPEQVGVAVTQLRPSAAAAGGLPPYVLLLAGMLVVLLLITAATGAPIMKKKKEKG